MITKIEKILHKVKEEEHQFPLRPPFFYSRRVGGLFLSLDFRAARLLFRASRSLASKSSSFNQKPSRSSHTHLCFFFFFLTNHTNHHQRSLLFPFSSSPTFPTHPSSTCIRLFSSKPNKAVTLTSIVHELADAGRPKEALAAFRSFIAAGIIPESQDYNALVKALLEDPDSIEAAKQCVLDMVRNGPCIIHVSEISYMPVHVGFVKQGKAEEGKEFLKEIKAKGLWGAQEKAVREALKSQEESEVQSVLDTVLDDSDDENEDDTIPEHFEGMETFFYKNIKTLFPFRHHCAAMNVFNGLVEDYQNLCQVEDYQNLCREIIH